VKWLRKAAEQGVAEAQFYLGNFFFHGQGVKRDLHAALKWFREAAREELPEAKYDVANTYNQLGFESKPDERKAF
jgi:TPR repeat protein